jgi:hypothetical protein
MPEKKEKIEVAEKVTPTKVQIILRKSEYAVVQWDDGVTLQRAWVPSIQFKHVDTGGWAEMEKPEEWPPYGESWSQLFELSQPTPEMLDRELKLKGIWTIQDLQAHPDKARGALMKIYGLDMQTMLNTAASKLKATGGNP